MINLIFIVLYLLHHAQGWCQNAILSELTDVFCVDYSPDGTMIATTTTDHLSIWNAKTKQLIYRKSLTNGQCVQFSHDSSRLAVSDQGSDIQVISTSHPYSQVNTYDSGNNQDFTFVHFNSDSTKLLACYGNDKKARVFRVSDATEIFKQSSDVLSCSIDSNDNVIVGKGNDKVQFYNIAGSKLYEINSNVDDCRDMNFYQNNQKIIAACKKEAVVITNSSQTATVILTDGSNLRTSEISSSGAFLLFGGDQEFIYIVNGTSNNHSVISQFRYGSDVLDADFSDDEQYLIVATQNGSIYEYAQLCMECEPGFFRDASNNNFCSLCWNHLHGCGICTSATACIQCVEGYYVNSANTCDSCQTLIEGCSTCEDATTCKQCLPGFHIDGLVCKSCVKSTQGCLICTSATVCTQCEPDYFLNASNLCEKCADSPSCLRCISSAYCSECKIGYYENSGSCIACGTNCMKCESATNCTDCAVGFYPTTTSGCQQCPTSCLACNASQYCFDCVHEKYLDNGACVDCVYPCATCRDASVCTSCAHGYYYHNGGCLGCSYECMSCNDSSLCLSCSPGFYLSTNQCKSCQLLHSFCSECDENGCLMCENGYYLDGGQCKSCLIMKACLQCNTSTSCYACATDHYLTALPGNDSCAMCGVGCATCVSSSTCTNCHVGFYLDGGNCVECDGNCVSCSSLTACLSCEIGFYLSGTNCVSCSLLVSGCLQCYADGKCLSCELGMMVSSDALQCNKCPQFCTSCNDTQSCLSCQLGYYLSEGSCLVCNHNCSECEDYTHCTSCAVGYYLVGNNCQDCGQVGCVTCDGSGCLSCQLGYYLSSGSCLNCLTAIDRCLVCDDSSTCLYCSYGYYLVGGACSPCSTIEGCKHCESVATCLNCELGYYMNGAICTQCSAGCKSCTGAANCDRCIGGYTLQSLACMECNDLMTGCMLCDDNATCTKCEQGYYLNTTTDLCGLCSYAIRGCGYCNSSSICVHCNDGFYLQSNGCELCDEVLIGCQLCNSSSVCLSCDFGYYLSSGTCTPCYLSIPACIYCDDVSTCLKCQSGYYLDAGMCKSCQAQIAGCVYCNSATDCIQCEGGYYLDTVNGVCSLCSQKGCQICLQSDASKCLTCNSRYFYDSGLSECTLCRSVLFGCLECASSTTCSECDEGYYVDGSGCLLCSNALLGCGRCTSSTACVQCKAGYYATALNQCEECKVPLRGCAYCVNGTVCESCASGYYMNTSNLCQKCTTIDGCVECVSSTHCQFCEPNYYMNNNLCYPCSVMTGCYACTSGATCSICQGGFVLNDNQLCSVMRVQAYEQIKELKLKTLYVNETTLQHILYAKSLLFDTLQTPNWTQTTQLILEDERYEQTKLVITEVIFDDNGYTLTFYTNNPLSIDGSSIPFTKRLLLSGTLATGHRVNLKMDQQTINSILPDLYLNKALIMDYELDSAEFMLSYGSKTSLHAEYSIFGIVVCVLFVVEYLMKAMCVGWSSEMGEIMPHVFALKMPALIIFPTYLQFVSYCYGFMTVDFPWANEALGALLGDLSDYQPEPYALFYENMNMGSTYFIGSVLVVIIGFIYLLTYSMDGLHKSPLGLVLNHVFIFGIVSCGCASFYGSLLNPIQSFSINSVFYVLGIAFYLISLIEAIYSTTQKRSNFYRIRIFIKGTLLAFANISPISFFFTAIVVDLVCMGIDYSQIEVTSPKCWLFKNICCDLALCILGIIPGTILGIVLCSVMIGLVLIVDVVVNIKEYKMMNRVGVNEKEESSATLNDSNMVWELNFDKNEESKDRKLETAVTKFIDTSDQLGRGMRRKVKRTKDQPKADVINVNSMSKLKDQEMGDELGAKEFRARQFLE